MDAVGRECPRLILRVQFRTSGWSLQVARVDVRNRFRPRVPQTGRWKTKNLRVAPCGPNSGPRTRTCRKPLAPMNSFTAISQYTRKTLLTAFNLPDEFVDNACTGIQLRAVRAVAATSVEPLVPEPKPVQRPVVAQPVWGKA